MRAIEQMVVYRSSGRRLCPMLAINETVAKCVCAANFLKILFLQNEADLKMQKKKNLFDK